MKAFIIHGQKAFEDPPSGVAARRAGFSLAALVFGPLYLLALGAWLPFFLCAAAYVVVLAAAVEGVLSVIAAAALLALGNLYLGLEAREGVAHARARAGRSAVDLVFAHSAIEAEKTFLERDAAETVAASPPLAAAARGGLEVIGQFPEAGR